MNTEHLPQVKGQELLARMARIPCIVQGKLSERRSNDKITGHKLQRWRAGRNQTRHIPASLLDTVQQGIEGYERFKELAQQYVEVREAEALTEESGSKKKPTRR